MNILKWIINKKKIEQEIDDMENEIVDQDEQYEKLLQDFNKMEGQLDLIIQRNNELEEEHTKQIETIGKLRKKITELKKEMKTIETDTH